MSNTIVLIPHYNNLTGLRKSLSSIKDAGLDLLIVDDGSEIKPDQFELQKEHPNNKIYVIYSEKNEGIENALNRGLTLIKKQGYKYIARLDCGDISHKERFKIQKAFLDQNEDYYLVGSWASFIDSNGLIAFYVKPPQIYEKIKSQMFLNNIFIHPTVMFRVSAINDVGLYPTDRVYAEDYAYFFKFVKKFKVAIIPEVLVTCEINPKGISLSKRKKQVWTRIKIIMENFELGWYPLWGILRNSILLCVPYSIIKILKGLKK